MSRKPHPAVRLVGGLVILIPIGLIVWKLTGPGKQPDYPRWEKEQKRMEAAVKKFETRQAEDADIQLVRKLLAEDLDDRDFSFATVAGACSGRNVIPLDGRESHRRVVAAVNAALDRAMADLGAEGSPVRSLRRINEVSRYFEDALHRSLDAEPDLACDIPHNKRGEAQRSGYPDLRIVHQPTGDVFYLDPKLVQDDSWKSTLRSFYFAPKDETLKITDDAVHLLAGIGHDGNDGAWKFTGHKLVDLSKLRVRLKAEFQASNADVYPAD
ncbi:hypothetical protein [Luteolibacter marinus]|uniref:hypothetical protein n=1 Tax=Luteolibacter marinus TaxID=2776705 RepID=UPI00186736B7|nr:hypothetical protein [Luteolibacter marinus]